MTDYEITLNPEHSDYEKYRKVFKRGKTYTIQLIENPAERVRCVSKYGKKLKFNRVKTKERRVNGGFSLQHRQRA